MQLPALRTQGFIGDDIIIVANFKCQSLDIALYTITSELRDMGGSGDVKSTPLIVKNSADSNGQIFGFKTTIPRSDTLTFTTDGEYALDFKFELNGQIQHTPRLAIEFHEKVTA